MILDREVEDVCVRSGFDVGRAQQRRRVAVRRSGAPQHACRDRGRLCEVNLCLGEPVRVRIERVVLDTADDRCEVPLLQRHARRRSMDSGLAQCKPDRDRRHENDRADDDPLAPQQQARVVAHRRLWPQVVSQCPPNLGAASVPGLPLSHTPGTAEELYDSR